MDIKLYEDQTGQMIFPEKRTDENKDIVRLFNNKIDLFIKKTGSRDELEISCYVLVQKSLERAIGCYIIYTGRYTKQFFTDFKNEANKLLMNTGFKLHHDDTENAIFNNIEKFDGFGTYRIMDTVTNALNSRECLYYKGGNITEITDFCKDILTSVKDIKLAISSEGTNLGEINILRYKTFAEQFAPTEKTKQALDRQQERISQKLFDERRIKEDERRKIEDEKKNKEKQIAKTHFDDGIRSMEKAVQTLRNAGFARNDTVPIFNEYANKINRVFEGFIQDKTFIEKPDVEKDIEISRDENKGIGSTVFAVAGVSIFLLGILTATFGFPYLSEKGILSNYHDIIPGSAPSMPAPASAPAPTLVSTLQTPVITPIPTVVPKTALIPSNTSGDINASDIITSSSDTAQPIQTSTSTASISVITSVPTNTVTPNNTAVPNITSTPNIINTSLNYSINKSK